MSRQSCRQKESHQRHRCWFRPRSRACCLLGEFNWMTGSQKEKKFSLWQYVRAVSYRCVMIITNKHKSNFSLRFFSKPVVENPSNLQSPDRGCNANAWSSWPFTQFTLNLPSQFAINSITVIVLQNKVNSEAVKSPINVYWRKCLDIYAGFRDQRMGWQCTPNNVECYFVVKAIN